MWKAAVVAVALSLATVPSPLFAEAKSARLLCNGYTGTGTLTDFQALVKLAPVNDYGFAYADCAANDGSDLWFTDASGNVIPHEVDTWAHNGDSFVWVKMPSVVPQTDENFPSAVTMHWGDLSAKQTTSDSVWTGFVGVWHMGEASGAEAEPDATTNNLSATPYAVSGTYAGNVSVMVPTNGVVGGGRINQTVANVNKGNGLKVTNYVSRLTDRSRFTVSGWWWADAKPWGDLHYISSYKGNDDADMLWVLKAGDTNTPTMKVYSLDKLTSSGGGIGVDSCYGKYVYMTLVYNGTSGALYSNGAMKYSTDSMSAVNIPDSATCWIGYYGKSARAAWCGRYDEVRMYNGAQSADRIVADYATMSTPSAFLVGDGSIARATWTGAAGDGDIGKSANWNCYDASGNLKPGELPTEVTAVTVSGANVKMQVPVGTTLVADSVTISSCTLGADCDWRGLASLHCSFDGVVDLSGRSLTVAALAGDGIITNSVSGDAAQLCISNVAEVVNSTVAIGGNVTLVKDGPGKFTSAKEQTYTGGTVVAAGTAQPPVSESASSVTFLTYSWDNFKAFGTGEIKVLPDATFDLRGAFAYRDVIVLAGGTLKNSSTMYIATQAEGSGIGRLEADSFVNATASIVFGSTNENHLCDLAGHTLSLINLEDGKFFNLETSFTDNPGKFTTLALPVRTGWFRVPEGFTVMATNVDFEISCRPDISGTLYAHDYTAVYFGSRVSGSGDIFVYGTFTPSATNEVASDCFHGCTMMDGSAIDLSVKTGPWPILSSYGDAKANLVVAFADNANVDVKLGSRRIAKDEAIMTWTDSTRPANLSSLTFRGVFNDRTVTLSKKDDGLYMPGGLIILFR